MRITFEQGIYELARNRILQDHSYQRKYPEQWEMNEEIFQEYRLFQLKKTLHYVYENSRFYRTEFDKRGITPSDINKMEDLSKLPFTYPNDLRGTGYEFLCTSQRIVERPVTFYSSGTTGLKKRIFFSQKDIIRIKEFISKAMHSLIDNEETHILSLMFNSQGRGASQLFCDSISLVGMKGYVADMEADSEEIIHQSMENNCNVWFADVITTCRIAKEMENKIDLKKIGIQLLFITMGNISNCVKMYLEKVFDCKVMTHYGLTEAGWGFAVDSDETEGYYYNELDVIVEIVDPQTGEPKEIGEEGEIVITVIGREAMPLIRYRTGDISAFVKNINGNRKVLKHIVRRMEGIYKIDDESIIYPAMLEDIIYTFKEVIDYRPYVIDNQLIIDVEVTDEEEMLQKEIKKMLERDNTIRKLGTPVVVRLLPIGSLKKYCYEKKRILKSLI